jgi:hypothetical protein
MLEAAAAAARDERCEDWGPLPPDLQAANCAGKMNKVSTASSARDSSAIFQRRESCED